MTQQIRPDRVERFIFVSERVRDEAIRLYGWPREKTVVIPNFVLDDEYRLHERSFAGPIRLGMVGIIPWRKRLDRAIDLLEALQEAGHAAELHIKGPRPEATGFMHAKGRREELADYEAQYARLLQEPRPRPGGHLPPRGERRRGLLPAGRPHPVAERLRELPLRARRRRPLRLPPAGLAMGGGGRDLRPGWIVGSTQEAAGRILGFRGPCRPPRARRSWPATARSCATATARARVRRLTDTLLEGT